MEEGIHYFTLNTGAKIPSLGIGTWQGDRGAAGSAVLNAIVTAIKAGYRHIDCARFYGNEKEVTAWFSARHVGLALKKLFEDGVVNREDLFITSKLWCTDHGPEEVPKALDLTLKDLQLDYVDLYLIHWPFRVKNGTSIAREYFTYGAKDEDISPEDIIPPNIQSTWRAMEELYDFGKAHAIGVSNFSTKKLADLLDFACVPPAVVQVECHPGWQQEKLHSFCKLKGIHLSGYTPLGSPGTLSNLLKDPILTTIAEDLRRTPAQIALRWGLQRGHSVIPKSTSEIRIRENLEIFDWSIPEDMLAKISAIRQGKLMRGEFCISERSGYRTLEELWDGEI